MARAAQWVVFAAGVGALLALGTGCPKSASQDKPLVGGIGKQTVGGAGIDLRISPDRKFLSFLRGATKPALDGAPAYLAVGELVVAPAEGGEGRVVGKGVTNANGGYAFSPDSHFVLFLRGYNAAARQGELVAADLSQPTAEPTVFGPQVSFFTTSADGKWVAFVDNGVLKVAPLGQKGVAPRSVSGEVSTASFVPGTSNLIYRRTYAAGGALFLASVDSARGAPQEVSKRVTDYVVSRDGKWLAYTTQDKDHPAWSNLELTRTDKLASVPVATHVGSVIFSADGKQLAWLQNMSADGQFGDLAVAETSNAKKASAIDTQVTRMDFAPDGRSIAALAGYRVQAREGRLVVASAPAWKAKEVSLKAGNFEWNSDSRWLAFNLTVIKPLPSVYLYLYKVGDEKPRKVEEGAYGFTFVPKKNQFFFRSACTKGEGGVLPRSCVLKALDLEALDTPAKTLTQEIYTFKVSEDGSHVLVTYARTDADAYDTAVYAMATGDRKTLDQFTELPGYFLDDAGSKVAYLRSVGKSSGLYLAQSPL